MSATRGRNNKGNYQATDWIFATNCTNSHEFGSIIREIR